MDQKELKTPWKTRIIVGIIAFLLLFSTVAVYVLIVLSQEQQDKTSEKVNAEMQEVSKDLTEKQQEMDKEAKTLSSKYFGTMSKYRSLVKSYNAKTVDNAGLKSKDYITGDGEEIKKDSSYHAYYLGWCADESVFDSSFDDAKKPTALNAPIAYTSGESSFIEGWTQGVVGMKTGGLREIDIPASLAYGDSQEVCGAKNSPLKFLVYIIDPGEKYEKLEKEYSTLMTQYSTLYYSQNQDEASE